MKLKDLYAFQVVSESRKDCPKFRKIGFFPKNGKQRIAATNGHIYFIQEIESGKPFRASFTTRLKSNDSGLCEISADGIYYNSILISKSVDKFLFENVNFANYDKNGIIRLNELKSRIINKEKNYINFSQQKFVKLQAINNKLFFEGAEVGNYFIDNITIVLDKKYIKQIASFLDSDSVKLFIAAPNKAFKFASGGKMAYIMPANSTCQVSPAACQVWGNNLDSVVISAIFGDKVNFVYSNGAVGVLNKSLFLAKFAPIFVGDYLSDTFDHIESN